MPERKPARFRRLEQREKFEQLQREMENPYFDDSDLPQSAMEGALPPTDPVSDFSNWVNVYVGAQPTKIGIFDVHLDMEEFPIPVASFGAYSLRHAERISRLLDSFYTEDLFGDSYFIDTARGPAFNFNLDVEDGVEAYQGGLKVLIEALLDYGDHWVNAYEITRHYGGPHEGGWWFNHYEPVATAMVKLDDNISMMEELIDNIYADIKEGDIYSVLGGADLSVVKHWLPAQRYPLYPPTYE